MLGPVSYKNISRRSFLRTGTVTAFTGVLANEALEALMGIVGANSIAGGNWNV